MRKIACVKSLRLRKIACVNLLKDSKFKNGKNGENTNAVNSLNILFTKTFVQKAGLVPSQRFIIHA